MRFETARLLRAPYVAIIRWYINLKKKMLRAPPERKLLTLPPFSPRPLLALDPRLLTHPSQPDAKVLALHEALVEGLRLSSLGLTSREEVGAEDRGVSLCLERGEERGGRERLERRKRVVRIGFPAQWKGAKDGGQDGARKACGKQRTSWWGSEFRSTGSEGTGTSPSSQKNGTAARR